MDYFMKWVKKPELLLQILNGPEKIASTQFTAITLRLDEAQFQSKHQQY
jgi:hypothetical protein